jgi:hypothetical protein
MAYGSRWEGVGRVRDRDESWGTGVHPRAQVCIRGGELVGKRLARDDACKGTEEKIIK